MSIDFTPSTARRLPPREKSTAIMMMHPHGVFPALLLRTLVGVRAEAIGGTPEYRITKSPGFTLVELLVVIAIIGMLIALLLPAVQSAREAAWRTQSANNLHQIGVALAMYEETYNAYPSGRGAPSNEYGLSWSFALLPFMEQDPIFNAHDETKPVFDPANSMSMRTTVATFINPMRRRAVSDRPFDNNGQPQDPPLMDVGAAGDYAANVGWQPYRWGTGPFYADLSGPFLQNGLQVKLRQVTDGTSHTLAVGDRFIPEPGTPIESYDTNFYSDHAFFSGDHPALCCRTSDTGFPTGPDDPDWKKFGNQGYDMTAFVFVDGHVEWLDNSMSLTVYRWLSVCADGEVISADEY